MVAMIAENYVLEQFDSKRVFVRYSVGTEAKLSN